MSDTEQLVRSRPSRGSLVTAVATSCARRWRRTLSVVVLVIVAGLTAFSVGLDREGFPPINTPIAIVSGTYFVDDVDRVDQDVLIPIEARVRNVEGVVEMSTTALPNVFVAVVEFEPSVPSAVGAARLEALDLGLPSGTEIEITAVDAAKFVGEFDLFVSIVSPDDPATRQAQATELAAWLTADSEIARAEVQELVTDAVDPQTGESELRATGYASAALDSAGFTDSVGIGIVRAADSDLDVLEFSRHVDGLLERTDAPLEDEAIAAITADFARGVQAQLDSLSSNLIGGLIAVVLVGLVMIGWRAAALKAAFVVVVMLAVLVALWVIGYTLNTITLFGLILTLGLLVDNAVVVTESLDASSANPDPSETDRSLGVIRTAIDRVGSATLAGTLTTVVVFSPMLLIGGNLGEFVRPIPATVIVTLVISFVLAMVTIPLAGRWVLARGAGRALGAPVVDAATRGLVALTRLSTSSGAGRAVGAGLVLSSLLSVVAGVQLASRLDFSIFPAGKDANGLTVTAEFEPGTTLEAADDIAKQIDTSVSNAIGDDLVRGQYVIGDDQELEMTVDLTALGSRNTTAPEFAELIETDLDDLEGVRIAVKPLENGPPIIDFPFAVQITVDETSLSAGQTLAEQIRADLDGRTFRTGGNDVAVVDTVISTDGEIARLDGARYIEVRAKYADTSGLTGLLSATEEHVASTVPNPTELGLAADALAFDFGEESDNQDDFAALNVAGIVALVLMLLVITVQFRSLAQSLLVFLAIPFSFLGVTGTLTLTDNPLSFLAAIGFIALIGVSVNNSILLIDAANQARRAGASAPDAIVHAVSQRFRPLVTTTLTTIAGLAPLAIADPFWESLGFTLMGGLVSSTVLVLLAFPVYYVALEAARSRTNASVRRLLRR